MTRFFSILLMMFFLSNAAWSQSYQIDVEVANFSDTVAYLGYYYGDKQYLLDTVPAKKGKFTFEGAEPLEPGMYLVVLPPNNDFVQVVVSESEQKFKMAYDLKKAVETMKFKNSEENKRFYEYMNFLAEKRSAAEPLRKAAGEGGQSEAEKAKMQKELDQISESVKQYQLKLIKEMPNSFTAALIRSGMDLEVPEIEAKDAKDKQYKTWQYFRKHWFDNIALDDDRLVRSPTLFQKVDYYMNKLTVQHPDSLSRSLDTILHRAMPAKENFKFFLIYYVNEYAKSKYVGMDAVYVHLVKNYYATGMASWADEEQVTKMVDDALKLERVLIGKTAPNISMQTEDKQKIELHEVESPYIVLLFWDTDCGHCKKAMPKIVDFEQKFRDKGVKVFAVCTKASKDFPECWEQVKEKNMDNFINVVDPYLRYKSLYDVRTTPRIFVLDENKEIISKSISAEQLGDVMDRILEMREKDKAKEQKTGD